MRTGLLTEPITIYKAESAPNDYGELLQNYRFKCTTRARVIHGSGYRENTNNEVFYSYNKTFELWLYVGISETDYIEWNDKKYRVLSIEPVREQNKQIVETELVNE